MDNNKLIGMILPDGANQFFSTLAQSFQRELNRFSYGLVVFDSDSTIAGELQNIQTFSQMNMAGLIFISVSDSNESFIQLRELSIPMLVLDREVPLDNADFLLTDNNKGIELILDLIKLNNFKKVSIINGLLYTEPGRIRAKKFTEGLKLLGITIEKTLIFNGDFKTSSGNLAGEKIINMKPRDRPDVVFSANDLMAIGLIQELLGAGIKIPEDIAVIGFDDIPMASWIYPRLTTIKQDVRGISKLGTRLLLERLQKNHTEARLNIVIPALVLRESCTKL